LSQEREKCRRALAKCAFNAHIAKMNETPSERKKRLALQVIDGTKAAAEYREKMDAIARRTAQLRAERLAREAAQGRAANSDR
jgi:hypothetical protein